MSNEFYSQFGKHTRLPFAGLVSENDCFNICKDFDARKVFDDADYITAVVSNPEGTAKELILYGRQVWALLKKNRVNLFDLEALTVDIDADSQEFRQLCEIIKGRKLQLDYRPDAIEIIPQEKFDTVRTLDNGTAVQTLISVLRTLFINPELAQEALARVQAGETCGRSFEQCELDNAVGNLNRVSVIYAKDILTKTSTIVFGKDIAAELHAGKHAGLWVEIVDIEKGSEQLDILLMMIERFRGHHEFEPGQDWT
jgi:hypothetical protein